MAQLILEVNNAHVQRILDAFGYVDEATNGTPAVFMKEQIIRLLQIEVKILEYDATIQQAVDDIVSAPLDVT